MNEYENLKTADIIAEALIDWNVDVIFGLPGDGINGFIEALRQRKNKIKFSIYYPIYKYIYNLVWIILTNIQNIKQNILDLNLCKTEEVYSWIKILLVNI